MRIGVHTGAPVLVDDGYVGSDVHLGARIAASAHGGQIILSKDTRRLLPDGIPVVDLGEHRLKDFEEPVSIFQIGDEPFPRLKTLANTNLPSEFAEIVARLREGTRLLTLTGPGGIGKTRLALQAAAFLVPAYTAAVSSGSVFRRCATRPWSSKRSHEHLAPRRGLPNTSGSARC